MNLPIQATPIYRDTRISIVIQTNGITPSDACCGPAATCLGACVTIPFGGSHCAGPCVPLPIAT